VENIFINALYDDILQEGLPPSGWHAYLRREMPSPPPSPRGQGGEGGEGGEGGSPGKSGFSLGLRSIAQLQRWGGRSRHGAAVRRYSLPFEGGATGGSGAGGDADNDDDGGGGGGGGGGEGSPSAQRSLSAPGQRGSSLSRAALPPTSESSAMLPLAPLRHHASPMRYPTQRVRFSASSPASSPELGRSGPGPGRSPASLLGGSGSSLLPRRSSLQPEHDMSARWQRSDAAREATAEAHLAADAAAAVASHARDAGARAMEARQSVSDLMSAFHKQLPIPRIA
jgi:hypothetical protein